MIPLLTGLTLRQTLRQRRTLLLVLLALLPVGLAVLFRVTGGTPEESPNFPPGILAHFVLALVLPLVALVVGSAALGQELEDGTVVYLIAKPLARWKVVVAKVLATWIVVTGITLFAVIGAGLVMLGLDDPDGMLPAFIVATLLGSLAYSALFVSLSIRFARALIIGLAYVFVWEALLSQFVDGVRFFSIRSYSLSIADALSDSPSNLIASTLGASTALVLVALVVALATVYAVRRLDAYEVSERV